MSDAATPTRSIGSLMSARRGRNGDGHGRRRSMRRGHGHGGTTLSSVELEGVKESLLSVESDRACGAVRVPRAAMRELPSRSGRDRG